MSIDSPSQHAPFLERRQIRSGPNSTIERRQFANSLSELSEGAQEIGHAIDQYKLEHRRKFITYEEMFEIITSLGYTKQTPEKQ